MKKFMVVVLMVVTLTAIWASVASAEHGNIGGIGCMSIRIMESGNISGVGIR